METEAQQSLRPRWWWRHGPAAGVALGLAATALFWGPLGPIATPLLVGLLACGVITVPFAIHGGLARDAEGLRVRSLMAGRHLPWDRIEKIHWHERRQAICLHLVPPEPEPGAELDPATTDPPPLQFFNWYGLTNEELIEWLSPPGES